MVLREAKRYITDSEAARKQDLLFTSNNELMTELAGRFQAIVIAAEHNPRKKKGRSLADTSMVFWVGSKSHTVGLLTNAKHLILNRQPDPPEEPWTSV